MCICLSKLSVYCRSDVIVSGRNDITIYNNMQLFSNSSPECGSTQVLWFFFFISILFWSYCYEKVVTPSLVKTFLIKYKMTHQNELDVWTDSLKASVITGVTFPRWKVYCVCMQLCFFTSSCSLNPAHWAFKSLCWCSWPYLLTGLHCWDKGLWNKADLRWLKEMVKLTGHPRSLTARGQQSCDMNSQHCCQAGWSSTPGLSRIWYKSTSHPKVTW